MKDEKHGKHGQKDKHGKKDNGITEITYEFTAPPPKKHWTKYILDTKEKTFFTRTAESWGKLGLFYLIFYIVLASMFAICMQGLLMSITEEHPTWMLEKSLIGTNPGVGFRPISEDTAQGSLIWYNAKEPLSVQSWTSLLDKFLEPYNKRELLPGHGSNQVNCEFERLPKPGQVCRVDVSKFGPCSTENGYGYNKSAPCFFIKLNRIFNWLPEYFDDPNQLPNEMPDDLKAHIRNISNPEHRKQVWVSCQPAHVRDSEIIGPIRYFPAQGVPGYFYPYTNTPGYLSPIIAVQLERPTPHEIISVECRAWAKNIFYRGGRERSGSVQFEVMVD